VTVQALPSWYRAESLGRLRACLELTHIMPHGILESYDSHSTNPHNHKKKDGAS